MDIEKLKEYLDAALDSLGNAISVLEDADQQPGTTQKLREARADIINIIDMAEAAKEPQVQNIDYGASCGRVHPGQSCGEWMRSQVYGNRSKK
jgi:hypothetical protein